MGKSRIYKSSNSGSSWTMVKSGTTNSAFYGLWFQDDLRGTIVGASLGASNQLGIVQTEDGGQTWIVRQQGSSGGYYDVHFPSENVGYAIGGTTLAKTTNGGATWTYTQPITNTFCESIWFTDDNTGFVGRSINNIGISKTTNGGSTFTTQPNFLAETMYFINSQVGWAMPENSTTMYKTTDGGETWEYWTTPGTQSGRAIFFLDEQVGWVGGMGFVNRTTDGGLTWNETFVNSEVLAIKFLTPQNGFCVTASNTLYTSNDGGATWNVILQTTPFVQGGSLSAFFTDEYCYVSSSGGMVYRAGLGCEDLTLGTITGDTEWCENQLGQLGVPQVVGATSYEWDLPEGWTGAENDWLIQPVPSAQGGLVSVTVTNQCGETATQLISVSVTPEVSDPVFSDLPEVICANTGATLVPDEDVTATSYTYQSTFGMSTQQNGDALVILPGSGSGTVFVTAENACGESEVVSIPIVITQAPEAALTLSADSICVGLVLLLDGGTPAGGVYSGQGVSGNVFDATGLPAGMYEISYSVANVGGCEDSATALIEVVDGGTGVLSIAVPDDICSGEVITFELLNASLASEIQWIVPLEWELVSTSGNQLTAVVNASATLTATVSGICEAVIIDTAVEVNGIPSMPALSIPSLICAGQEITWEAIAETGEEGFGWIVPQGFPDPGNSSTWSFSPPVGTWETAVFSVGTCQNSDTLFTTFTVASLPEPSIVFEDDTLCLAFSYIPELIPSGGDFSGPGWDGQVIATAGLQVGPAAYVYTVTSADGCSATATSEVFLEICQGTTEYSFGDLLLYPNPADDFLRVNLPRAEGQLIVSDHTGRIVHQHAIRSTAELLDVSALAAGVYSVIWTSPSSGTQTTMLVIERE
ncbi:MAG: T9SS type A sorting domain-containing protein [Flavobacteriales bacterium]